MVRLELSLAEAYQLQQWMTDTLHHQPAAEVVTSLLLTLLPKLTEVADNATQRHQCPICQQWFVQENSGRAGQYCGAACKQKAGALWARRRRLNARKQFEPSPKR